MSTAAAHVDPISEDEIPEVAEYLARQVPAGEAKTTAPLPPAPRLRWLLLENPRRAADIPLGWRIRDGNGAIVGACICTPYRISTGPSILTALMFSKFYVDLPSRGMGLGLLMRFVREGNRFVLFCTSTNAVAGQLFAKLGFSQISGLDHTMLGIARPRPLAEEWLSRGGRAGRIAPLLALPAALLPGRVRAIRKNRQGELSPVASVEELQPGDFPTPPDITAIVRDRDYLQWRYFSGQRDKQVYRYRHGGEGDRLVVVNEVCAGYRAQIRVLNVLDVWPPTTASSAPALCGALARQYAGRFDCIWLRSQPVKAEAELSAAGFVRRTFPAPLGWYSNRENRLLSKNWYVMPGESE